jgi:hypothetical protein
MYRLPWIAVIAILILLPACSDVVEPASAQSADLQRVEALLQEVLVRLDTLEARNAQRASEVLAGLDTLVVVVQQPGGGSSAGVQLEAAICFERSRRLTAEAESKIRLEGRGRGNVGIDAYGNGAQAFVLGLAGQVVQGKPSADWNFKATICGKGYGESDVGALRDAVAGIVQSVSADHLATVASALDMNGTRMNSSLDVVPTLSMSQFGFGTGVGADLLASLPLPSDLSSLLADPNSLLGRASDAADYALARLCDQSFFTGDFAQRASEGCSLRDQLSPAQVVGIVQGLDSLPVTLSLYGANLSSLCTGFNTISPQRLVIPSYTVNFPLGIGDVMVFPGYNQRLFPNQGPVC